MSSSAKGGFYCTHRCVCVCFLLQNEASGMFIESPWPLSALPAIITERAAPTPQPPPPSHNDKEIGNAVHLLSVSVWSSSSVSDVSTRPSPHPPAAMRHHHDDSSGALNAFSMQAEHSGPRRQTCDITKENALITPPAQRPEPLHPRFI